MPEIQAGPGTLINESCPPSNSAIDPGERVTVHLRLTNAGDAATNNLVAPCKRLGINVPSSPQSYGAIAPSTTIGRDFSLTVDPALICGGTLTATLQLQDGTTDLGTVTYTFTIGVNDDSGGFVWTTPCDDVRLVVTTSLTRTSPSNVQASVNVQNIGTVPANNTMLTTAKVGSTSTSTPLPQLLGTIPPSGSVTGVLNFHSSSSGASVLSVGGTYSGGAFSSSRRVTLP